LETFFHASSMGCLCLSNPFLSMMKCLDRIAIILTLSNRDQFCRLLLVASSRPASL
jgi:hypothetical protein